MDIRQAGSGAARSERNLGIMAWILKGGAGLSEPAPDPSILLVFAI